MKNLFIYAFVSSVFFYLPSSGQKVLKGKLNGEKSTSTFSQKSLARDLFKSQRYCQGPGVPDSKPCNTRVVTDANCGKDTTYCDNPECIEKIMYCHEICKADFDALTTDENQQQHHSKSFRRRQLKRTIGSDVCSRKFVQCYVFEDSQYTYFRMGNRRTTEPEGEKYETFYSIALLQGIMKAGKIKSFRLFKGVPFEVGGKTVYMLPFKVIYRKGDVTRYYDVSDTQP